MTYITSDDLILWTNDEGTKRIRAVHDNDPHEPYNDGAMPTLQLGAETQHLMRGQYGLGYQHADGKVSGIVSGEWVRPFSVPNFEDIYREFDMKTYDNYRIDARDVFARYLRVYHGSTTFYEYENYQYTRDYKYIAFDTAAWRERVGCPDDKANAEEDFDEYRHYLEGETYGVILEHKVQRTISTVDLAFPNRPWEDEEDEDWVEDESVWGFYTDNEEELTAHARWTFGVEDKPASA